MKVLETRKADIIQSMMTAGEIAVDEFSCFQSVVFEEKSHKEMVSSVDLKLEKFLSTEFKKFTNIKLFSEESSFEGFLSEKTESILFDPLDGTHNFIYGLPMWGITVSFFNSKGIIEGSVVGIPLEGKVLFIGEELELYVDGVLTPFGKSGKSCLGDSLVFYDNQIHKVGAVDFLHRFDRLVKSSFTLRIGGSSSWDIFKVVTTNAGARIFGNVEYYDLAPALALSTKHNYSLLSLGPENAFVFGKDSSLTEEIKDCVC